MILGAGGEAAGAGFETADVGAGTTRIVEAVIVAPISLNLA